MGVITTGELAKATMTQRQAHFRAVMSGLLQVSPTNGTGVEKEAIHSSLGIDTVDVKEFCLDDVWGPVCTIHPFGMVSTHGNTSVRGHCMQVHLLVEPTPGPQVTFISGANCHPGRVTSGILLGAHLFAKCECSSC